MAMKNDISKRPMIFGQAIGLATSSSPYTVNCTAQKLGLKPTRMPNGRALYSFEQAEAIALELLKITVQ